MPKNLGLYNDNLSIPRKQDIDNVQDQINTITQDLENYVVAEEPEGIVDTIPPTFGGNTVDDFVLKNEIVDNLNSDSSNLPLSANQGKILNEDIQQNTTNIQNVQSQINNKLNISGGTMMGMLIAQSNTNYTTGQVRNIYLSTELPTDDVGNNGDIWIIYGG